MKQDTSPNMRMLYLLEAIANAPNPITVAELSQQLHLPKPSMHRLVKTLLLEGYLEKQGQQLTIARRTVAMASNLTLKNPGNVIRHHIMRNLAEKTQETINFVVPTETGMTYADRVETGWHFRVMLPVGSDVPYYCTASGKTYLASLRKSQLVRLVDHLNLEARTPHTIIDKNKLIDTIKQVRKNGYALDDEELYENMLAVAVPVYTPSQHYCGALAVHGPKSRFGFERALSFLPDLKKASEDIAQALFDNELR